MGLFDRRIEDTQEAFSAALKIADLETDVRYLGAELREAKEDLLKIADAFDNVGWAPLNADNAMEIKLETVKKAAKVSRALYSMNPFVNRGVNARIGYIWGRGVMFDGVEEISDVVELNRKKLFNNNAYTELERVLSTDGNSFTAVPVLENPDENTVFRVPLDQIMSAVSNPNDIEDIWYYRREWETRTTNGDTGDVTAKKMIKYYPSMDYWVKLQKQGKNLPRRWKDAGVEQNYVMHHVAVNKQVGWRWGVPDILPVIFWAKAYKEYLEDNATLVKAYSRLAWQIQAGTAGGAQAAGAQVMTAPTRDPMTGELRNIGGTSVSGPGTTATAVAPTGSQVDFDKGSALAAAIASGLQVSKVVITSDPGAGNRATAETLDLPTLKAMEARQQLHTERFLEFFQYWGANISPLSQVSTDNATKGKERDTKEAAVPFGDSAKKPADKKTTTQPQEDKFALVTWPQIESDSTKDRIAALGTAAELGVIFKQEARKDALETLGIAPYKPWDVLPTIEDDPAAQQKMEAEAQNAELAFQREQSVIAKQGVTGGVSAVGGAQSGGSNTARDNRAQDSRNK